MIASLAMYAHPKLTGAHERYWDLIRDRLGSVGIRAPEILSQTCAEFDVWNDPELVLSQTCGLPYRLWLHNKVALVGTPDFGVNGCQPGYYRSAFLVRAEDPRPNLAAFEDSVFAYNQTFSQSGYAAPWAHTTKRGFWFKDQLHCSQHLESARAVALAQADIASLDAISWRLIQRYESFADKLRVLEWTIPTPGLPYITARVSDASAVFEAIRLAISDLDPIDKEALGIRRLVAIPKSTYLGVENPPDLTIENPLT